MSMLQVVSILMSVIGAALASTSECDQCRQLPRQKTAVCNLKAETGVLYYPNCTQGLSSPGRVWLDRPGDPCILFAGMDVLFEDCPSVYRGSVAAGKELAGRSLQSARGQDAGEYVCVDSDGVTVLGRRNITVSDSPAITSAPANIEFECREIGFPCDPNTKSCSWRGTIIGWGQFPATMGGYVRKLHVYGQHPINMSVAVKWDNPMRRVTAADLGIQLYEGADSLLHEYVVFSNGSGHWPETLVDYSNGTNRIDRAQATVTVEAHNSAGSSRLQFMTNFEDTLDPSRYYGLDESLPDDQTVPLGNNAQFSCEFSTSTNPKRSLGFNVLVRWRMPTGLEEGCNCSKRLGDFSCACQTSHVRITHDSPDSGNTDRQVLAVRGSVDSVSANDTGSVFSCALATPGEKFEDDEPQDLVIQWIKAATLTVIPHPSSPSSSSPSPNSPSLSSPSPSSSTSSGASIGLSVGVPLALVLGAGAAIAIAPLLWLMKRRRKNAYSNIESVPLESHPIPDDSTPASTPLASMCLLPTLTAAQALHLRSSSKNPSVDSAMDGGSLSSGEDSLSPPSSNRSQEGTREAINMSFSLPPEVLSRRRVCVYISYTERKADWVMSYLKPLIESFHGTAVSVSDTDMVPGHVVSEERLRLILKADKVVIVCSPDYSSSPWCQFELYQAIAKQPSLRAGRVIPILCDGCGCPPSVVGTVVGLSDTDQLFPERLREAILKHRHTKSDCFSTVS